MNGPDDRKVLPQKDRSEDHGEPTHIADLRRVSALLARMADDMEKGLVGNEGVETDDYLIEKKSRRAAPGERPSPSRMELLARAQFLSAVLRLRKERLRELRFHDPAWAALLTLFAEHLKGRRVMTTSLGYECEISQTTLLRYIDHFAAEGLVIREAGSDDARVTWLSLTDLGVKRMTDCLSSLLRSEGGLQRSWPALTLAEWF